MVNHSQRTRICCVATMGKVWVVFCVSLRAVYLVLLALHCACPAWVPCRTGLLGYVCKCDASTHRSTYYCFFHKDKTTIHLPHDMQQQSMHYSYIQSWKPAVIGCSNGQHQDQYSRWRHGVTFSGQRASYYKG